MDNNNFQFNQYGSQVQAPVIAPMTTTGGVMCNIERYARSPIVHLDEVNNMAATIEGAGKVINDLNLKNNELAKSVNLLSEKVFGDDEIIQDLVIKNGILNGENTSLRLRNEKLSKSEKTKTEWISIEQGGLVYSIKNDVSGETTKKLFADWKIDNITHVVYDVRENREDAYFICVGEKKVIVTKSEYENGKIYGKFISAGLSFKHKASASEISRIMGNYLAELEITEYMLVFNSGWYCYQGIWNYKISVNTNPYDSKAPLFKNYIPETDRCDVYNAIYGFFQIFEDITDPQKRVVLLCMVIYPFIYSLLHKYNVKAGNIFLVDIPDKRWEKLFFNIIENEESISINETKENLIKKIVSVKDSFFNIETRGYDLSSKKVKENLKQIQNVFCGDGSVEFMGREWKSEAPVFMHVKDTNSFICKNSDIEKSAFFKICIDTDDISSVYYPEIVNEYGVFILLFLEMVKDYIGILKGWCNDIYNGVMNDPNIADSYKDTYAAFYMTLMLIGAVLNDRYEIKLGTELNITDENVYSLLEKYFRKISFDENDIIDDILEQIKEIVKDTDEITEILGRRIDKDTDLNKSIFICSSRIIIITTNRQH